MAEEPVVVRPAWEAAEREQVALAAWLPLRSLPDPRARGVSLWRIVAPGRAPAPERPVAPRSAEWAGRAAPLRSPLPALPRVAADRRAQCRDRWSYLRC